MFNLTVVHSCDLQQIRNAEGAKKTACSVLSAGSDRVRRLSRNVIEMLPECSSTRVKPYCNTRFIEHHSGVIPFVELLLPIVATLEQEVNRGKSECSARENEMLSAICNCEFIVALAVIESLSLSLYIC